MSTTTERRIALFLDFENLVTNTGVSATHFDLQPALDRLLEKGKVVFRRAYCDWSRFRAAKGVLHELGVELVDVPPSTRSGKNGADMRLVIDALELCYAREHIDTFVIASGDSDFCPLAYKLRENNRFVIGLGVKEATSPFFVKACDEFLYLRPGHSVGAAGEAAPRTSKRRSKSARAQQEEPKPEPTEPEAKAKAPEEADGAKAERPARTRSRRGRGSKTAKKTEAGEESVKPPLTSVPEIAREVIQSLLARATGPVNPSFLKEAIVRKEPDFDEREHGFSNFMRLLAEMETAGLLKRQQSGRQWYVLPPDVAAPAAAPDATEPS